MMAALAKARDDISGAIATGGTSTAYTVASYGVFDTLAHMDGQIIAFTPHASNTDTNVTLNVDGLGAKHIRSAPNIELQTGALIQGTPYLALYNNSDGAFYLHGASNYNSYSCPLGGGMIYFGATAPNSSFALPYGQAINRNTYSTLFSLISTTFGSGDGSTTFNLPDLRGRYVAGLDNMGGSSASRLSTAMTSTSMGNTGGNQQSSLVTNNLPAYTPSGSLTGTAQVGIGVSGFGNASISTTGASHVVTTLVGYGTGTLENDIFNINNNTLAFSGSAQGGTSAPFTTIPPTMVANFIMRVI